MTAIGRRIFKSIGLRLERDLRDHVIICDRKPIGRDQKARANRGLPSGVSHQRADLQQPRGRCGINGLCRRRCIRCRPDSIAVHRHNRQHQPQRARDIGDGKSQEIPQSDQR